MKGRSYRGATAEETAMIAKRSFAITAKEFQEAAKQVHAAREALEAGDADRALAILRTVDDATASLRALKKITIRPGQS